MPTMQRLSQLRFDALAGYIRDPRGALVSEEIRWYSDDDERVLGTILRDTVDDDYVSIILGRDERRCFRAVDVDASLTSLGRAKRALNRGIESWCRRPDADFYQRVKSAPPVDFFQAVVLPKRLNKTFESVSRSLGYSPAREIIAAMMYYFEDPDGNFVEQFQTTGFDARVWELYLFAALHELGFAFDRSFTAPDYLCNGLNGRFFVEAVTVNPTLLNGVGIECGPPQDRVEFQHYVEEYLPIKFGSALYSKLKRRYWELPHVAGSPIVLAIQDFHFPHSMAWSEPYIAPYLYGKRYTAKQDEAGTLVVEPKTVSQHSWGDKVIPSGFFFQPGAEHISAVLTNSQGTLSKFNRLGFIAGFGSRFVEMTRVGTHYVHDPNAARSAPFTQQVHSTAFSETWVEGMNVYHNPKAMVPLPPQMLPTAAHHRLTDTGMLGSVIPEFHPFGSETTIRVRR
jgi:hypothetical protein